MRIICATTWNDEAFYWNVERQRWDYGRDVIPGKQHEAHELDMEAAQDAANVEKMIVKALELIEIEA